MAEKKRKIGEIAIEALRAHLSNEAVLRAVQDELGDGKTKMSSISWYRNKLRQEGEDVPTARALKRTKKEDSYGL